MSELKCSSLLKNDPSSVKLGQNPENRGTSLTKCRLHILHLSDVFGY
jgi:hypothetical protein